MDDHAPIQTEDTSLAAMEASARDAFAALPEEFRALTDDLIIQVTDWPDDEVLRAMDAQTPFDILGLFMGIGRAQGPATPSSGQMPNMIWLYREPILAYWRQHDERLGDIVSHVLVHEIGHHFGLSDDDMEQIEREAQS